MLNKLIKLIPNTVLIKLYKLFPISSLKNWLAHRVQQKFVVGVIGIILNEKGEVLLLHHDYRDKPWGLPSGWLEKEQPMDGLKRELYEETGFHVELTTIYQSNFHKKSTCIDIIFIGKWTGGSFKPSDEINSYKFCSLQALPEDIPESQKQLLASYSSNL